MKLSTREPVQPRNWISGAINPAHKGALHRALGVPVGETIPAKKISAAEQSDSPKLRRMATLAETLKGFHHGSR